MLSLKPLTQLGLTEKEALIYISLQEDGECLPSYISEKLNVPRSTIYENLKELIKKGLVEETGSKPKKYSATSSKNLLTMEQKKINNLNQVIEGLEKSLPELNQIYKKVPHPIVKLYEGEDGVLNVYKQILVLNQNLYSFNAIRELPDKLSNFWSEFPNNRRNKFVCHAIISVDKNIDREDVIESWQSWNAHPKDTLYLVDEEKYPSPGNIYILDEITIFIIFEPEPMAITIQNQEIAETMQVLHQMARNAAKKEAILTFKASEE